MLNLAILLEASAQDYPDQLAVIFNDRKITYAQLNAAANMFANGLRKLRRSIRHGQRNHKDAQTPTVARSTLGGFVVASGTVAASIWPATSN